MEPEQERPLDRYPVIRTSDVDEMRVAVGRIYGDLALSVSRDFSGFRAHGNHCQFNDIGISYASFGAPIRQAFPHYSAGYAMPFAVAGAGWGKCRGETMGVSDRETLIASPGSPVELNYGADFATITVQIDGGAMRRKLAALIGAEINGTLEFEVAFDRGNPTNRLWWRLLQFLIAEAELREPDLPRVAFAEIEQALIVMFLKANRHSFSHLLDRADRSAAPRQVRLAEEYIEAHWNQTITVETLARVTNVSARSVFDSFRKSRGYSPMAFVKQVRLRHARRMLVSPQPGTSVSSVATMCGFGNLGNFARDYRKAFGELPSDTLKRGTDR